MIHFSSSTHLHVVFKDVSSSRHVHDVIDDEFAESRKQIPPLMERLDLVGLVLLVSLFAHKNRCGEKRISRNAKRRFSWRFCQNYLPMLWFSSSWSIKT